jgi:putative transposase
LRHSRDAPVASFLDAAIITFPTEHWRSIRSTNALELVNAEIGRRAKVVGIFPNSASLLRLSTAVLQVQHDEWQDDRCHFSQQSIGRLDPNSAPRLTNPLTEGLAA